MISMTPFNPSSLIMSHVCDNTNLSFLLLSLSVTKKTRTIDSQTPGNNSEINKKNLRKYIMHSLCYNFKQKTDGSRDTGQKYLFCPQNCRIYPDFLGKKLLDKETQGEMPRQRPKFFFKPKFDSFTSFRDHQFLGHYGCLTS